jgi:hypothetical protein
VNAQEALFKAVDVLHERGWVQGQLERADGSVCLVGAINVAVTGSAAPRDAVWDDKELALLGTAAFDAVRSEVNEPNLGRWNDKRARDVDDVIDALKRAADRVPEAS